MLLRHEDGHRDSAIAESNRAKVGFWFNLPSCGDVESEASVGTGMESLRGGGDRHEERCDREVATTEIEHGRFSAGNGRVTL
jgi:hypothetical protein